MIDKQIIQRIRRLEKRSLDNPDEDNRPWKIVEVRDCAYGEELSEESRKRIEQVEADGYRVLIVCLSDDPIEDYDFD